MSNSQFAFVASARVPAPEALQAAIDKLGFDLKLTDYYGPRDNTGFLPLTLNGEEGPGFEIDYLESTDITGDDEELASLVGDRDCCIQMSWGGSMKDLACVMIVSAALTQDFDAIVSYEGEDTMTLDDLLAGAKAVLKDVATGAP